ncbi:MAG: hypothetical protein FWG25_06970 [Promicromonosporaceae bacterium]|nr:hypothetical protein [Promicromonosporaceae bacterium]
MISNSPDLARYTFGPDNPARIGPDINLDDEAVLINGRRYANSDADADADWLEATLPERLNRHRGLARGGQSLSADGHHSPTIGVVLPREVRDEVAARASAEKMSMSRWMRRLVERELASA